MKAQKLIDRRIVITENAFAEIVVHEVDPPKRGSAHAYKYRMAYIVRGSVYFGLIMKMERAITCTGVAKNGPICFAPLISC